MKITRDRLIVVALFVGMTIGNSLISSLEGQEVILQIGDKLELEVPHRQELGRQLVIDEGGEVEIPIIGAIALNGMTLQEAETVVLRKLQQLYPSVRRINLTLIGEESRRLIYVHGEVASPGKYEFKDTPSVWEAIREAGGTTRNASLDAVRLIRAEGEEKRTTIVNLQEVIDSGDFDSLPELKPGDTVIVPVRSMRYEGSAAVNVIGAVKNPAPYKLTGSKTLVDAILAAGGPLDDANLAKVKIIRNLSPGGTITLNVNFKRYLDEGNVQQNPAILPNDTVSVPKQSGYLRTILTEPRFLLGLITAGGTIAAIILSR